MFVVVLRYIRPLDEIDQHMKAHMQYLKTCYAGGLFIASGRRVPREGGVILARGADRAEIEGVVAMDPFVHLGLAEADIIEFNTSQFVEGFEPFADPGGRRQGGPRSDAV